VRLFVEEPVEDGGGLRLHGIVQFGRHRERLVAEPECVEPLHAIVASRLAHDELRRRAPPVRGPEPTRLGAVAERGGGGPAAGGGALGGRPVRKKESGGAIAKRYGGRSRGRHWSDVRICV